MNLYEYVIVKSTGVKHLTGPAPYLKQTLCGRVITTTWVHGDETPSGIAATCNMCRRIVGQPKLESRAT